MSSTNPGQAPPKAFTSQASSGSLNGADGGPLKEAFQALRTLESVRHENVAAERKNFDVLQSTFRKMKGLNNDSLPEYVRLQRQIIAYLHTPQYVNYYKS